MGLQPETPGFKQIRLNKELPAEDIQLNPQQQLQQRQQPDGRRQSCEARLCQVSPKGMLDRCYLLGRAPQLPAYDMSVSETTACQQVRELCSFMC